MKSWIRVIIVAFVLIGGTASFGYWSVNEFDGVFDDLSAAIVRTSQISFPKAKQNPGTASSDIFGALATSTGLGFASTSLGMSGALAASTSSETVFAFPQKDGKVYTGCTYVISWHSPTTILSLETILVDADTRDIVLPSTGGLVRERVIDKDSRSLPWKVGSVVPGSYYIKIAKINGAEAEIRSKVFTIEKTPSELGVEGQKDLCEKTGGVL